MNEQENFFHFLCGSFKKINNKKCSDKKDEYAS